MANSDVEVFDNDIYGNGTVNLSIVTYGYETEDENYNPHPKSIQIHNNRFGDGGFDPDVGTGELESYSCTRSAVLEGGSQQRSDFHAWLSKIPRPHILRDSRRSRQCR